MRTRLILSGLTLALAMVALLLVASSLFAQWQPLPAPQGPAQPPSLPQYPPPTPSAPPYPPQTPAYPPQAPAYPPQRQLPQQPQGIRVQPGQNFADVFGRFRVSLPTSTTPMGSTYNFAVPAAMAFVNIMAVAQDQMFQLNMSSFPNMLQQMGAKIDANRQIELRGRQAQLIAATMKDQQTGSSMHAMNVFVPGPNLWLQVMGPEQNAQQLGDVLSVLLQTVQFQQQ